jgi:hypothetical protein
MCKEGINPTDKLVYIMERKKMIANPTTCIINLNLK